MTADQLWYYQFLLTEKHSGESDTAASSGARPTLQYRHPRKPRWSPE